MSTKADTLRRTAISVRNQAPGMPSSISTEDRLKSADWLERLADALDQGIADPGYSGFTLDGAK